MNPAHPGVLHRGRIARRWGARLLVLNLVGYPIFGMLATVLNVDSNLLSIPFRAAMLVISVLLIAVLARRSPWWTNSRWLQLFWLLYLLRLMYDTFAGIPGATEALVFFVATVIVPGVAQGVASQHMPSQYRTAWLLALVGGIVCATALLLQTVFPTARMLDSVSSDGRLAFEALNPISLGHVATSTLLALLCLTCYRSSTVTSGLQIGIAAIAALCLVVAGSRGPMVSLGVAGFAFALMTRRWRWVFGLCAVIAVSLLRTENSLVTRFASGGVDASSLERLVIQGDAILQFLASPIFGSAHAELNSLEYPHNLFIETAMAMGVVGLLVLIILLFTTAARMRREWRTREVLAPVLFVQYFIAFQLSGSIWGAASFWALIAVLSRSSRASVAARMQSTPPRVHPKPISHA